MSAITTDDLAREWAQRLEAAEAQRLSISVAAARRRVADKIGVLPGTLENLSRQRLKGVREALFSRLRTAVINELKREIAAQTNELNALLATDSGARHLEVQEVAQSLTRLREVISREARQ